MSEANKGRPSETNKGKLEVISTHIGNPKDITLRAIESLRDADIVICEDLKEARRLLHQLDLQKELLPLNEHTVKSATEDALLLLRDGKKLALISDAGTPMVADPGLELVKCAIEEGISVTTLPGPTSIIPALLLSGFSTNTFTFAGFLPRDKAERKRAVDRWKSRNETLLFLEAPYRLAQILDDLTEGMGAGRNAAVCMDLTMPTERVQRGTLLHIKEHFARHPFKGEFVIVVEGNRPSGDPAASRQPHKRSSERRTSHRSLRRH